MTRKMKKRALAHIHFRLHNFWAWNGLITSGKDRHPRLLKALKVMQPIYIYCKEDWPEIGRWLYGCGFYLSENLVYFRDVMSGEERIVNRDLIAWFHVYKYVGCKDIWHDACDDGMKVRAMAFGSLLAIASCCGEKKKFIDKLDGFKKVIFKADGLNDIE